MKYFKLKRIYTMVFSIAFIIFLFTISPGNAQNGNNRIILHNAKIYTMADDLFIAEALLIEGNRIADFGTDDEIMEYDDGETEKIDLKGRAVYPGFIDPHTHLFGSAFNMGYNLDQIQHLALGVGITSAASMHVSLEQLNNYLHYANKGGMRLRLYLYLNYNDSCGNLWGTWYEDYSPKVDIGPKLRVNGVKIFSEKSVCGPFEHKPVFNKKLSKFFTNEGLEAWGNTQLLFSFDELKNIIQQATDQGYQVAVHAIGDAGIKTSLEAIEAVLRGSRHKKTNRSRHMILHNHFLTNDLLHKYAKNNIVALIEPPTTCQANYYADRVGERNMRFFKRVDDLVKTGAHVGLDSDWPYTTSSSDPVGLLNPMRKLRAIVTGKAGSCISDVPLQTVSVLQGLKMMTAEAAYALHCDHEVGTIEIDKFADLVVLSQDPFEVAPDDIGNIQVLLTMVGGKIEFIGDTNEDSIPDIFD